MSRNFWKFATPLITHFSNEAVITKSLNPSGKFINGNGRSQKLSCIFIVLSEIVYLAFLKVWNEKPRSDKPSVGASRIPRWVFGGATYLTCKIRQDRIEISCTDLFNKTSCELLIFAILQFDFDQGFKLQAICPIFLLAVINVILHFMTNYGQLTI